MSCQALQGIETLSLRMERHSSNGLAVAKHLENHSKTCSYHLIFISNTELIHYLITKLHKSKYVVITSPGCLRWPETPLPRQVYII